MLFFFVTCYYCHSKILPVKIQKLILLCLTDWNTVIDSDRIKIILFSTLFKVKLRASSFFYFLFPAMVVNEPLVIGIKKVRLTDTKTIIKKIETRRMTATTNDLAFSTNLFNSMSASLEIWSLSCRCFNVRKQFCLFKDLIDDLKFLPWWTLCSAALLMADVVKGDWPFQ